MHRIGIQQYNKASGEGTRKLSPATIYDFNRIKWAF